jgi:hypothetical protein
MYEQLKLKGQSVVGNSLPLLIAYGESRKEHGLKIDWWVSRSVG